MISLRKSIDEHEQLTALYQAAIKTLSAAIETSAQYAVELNPHDVGLLRQHLTLLASQAGQAGSAEEYGVIRSSFRGELRDYRDRATEELARLRDELKAAASAMQTFAEGLSVSADEHETHIKDEFSQLEAAAHSGDSALMSVAIGHAVQLLSKSCEEMKRGNQIVVAQLQDELRALHRELAKERRALYTDRSSGVWNRAKLDRRIEDLMRKPDRFCLLMVGIGNLRTLYLQHSRTMVEGSMKALVGRLANLVGDEAMIGRWSEDVFAVILDVDAPVAAQLRGQAEAKLSGSYSMQENGLAQKVFLNVQVGMVERERLAEAAMFYPTLGQVAETVVQAV